MSPLHWIRLASHGMIVEVRLRRIGTAWIASADAADGPSLGLGRYPLEAVARALTPFDDLVEDLLATVPEELYYWR